MFMWVWTRAHACWARGQHLMSLAQSLSTLFYFSHYIYFLVYARVTCTNITIMYVTEGNLGKCLQVGPIDEREVTKHFRTSCLLLFSFWDRGSHWTCCSSIWVGWLANLKVLELQTLPPYLAFMWMLGTHTNPSAYNTSTLPTEPPSQSPHMVTFFETGSHAIQTNLKFAL